MVFLAVGPHPVADGWEVATCGWGLATALCPVSQGVPAAKRSLANCGVNKAYPLVN